MLVKIIPHGALRATWPTDFEVEASTPYEAMNALCSQFQLGAPAPGKRWVVSLVGYSTDVSLRCPLSSPELHVVPSLLGGGGGGGFFKILIGAVLVAASFLLPGSQGFMATLASGMFSMGASLVLGGILELLTPAPKKDTPTQSEDKTQYLGAPRNTTSSDTPIPIAYGRFALYGHYLSFNIEADIGSLDLTGETHTSTEVRYGVEDGMRWDSGEGTAGDSGTFGISNSEIDTTTGQS